MNIRINEITSFFKRIGGYDLIWVVFGEWVIGTRNLKDWSTLVKTVGAIKDIVFAVDWCYQSIPSNIIITSEALEPSLTAQK